MRPESSPGWLLDKTLAAKFTAWDLTSDTRHGFPGKVKSLRRRGTISVTRNMHVKSATLLWLGEFFCSEKKCLIYRVRNAAERWTASGPSSFVATATT
jgi:hypothetical protein